MSLGGLTLLGDVYRLSFQDLQLLDMSNQIWGVILLLDPYDRYKVPYVTIQISQELKGQFAKSYTKWG